MQKNVSYGGIAAAIGVIFLILSAYVPSGKAALLFAASAVIYVLGVITNTKTAFISYLVTSAVAFLLGSSGSPVIICAYIICFGNYPVVRMLLEGRSKILVLFLKLFLYFVYFSGVYWVVNLVVGVTMPLAVWILFAGGALLFLLYDLLLPKTALYLVRRIFKTFK